MLHKIIILAATIATGSTFVKYFFFNVEINWWAVLVCGLVIVNNLRELQFDRIKEHYDATFLSLSSFRDATFSVCDDKTIDRILLKAADIVVETAPEECQPELRKMNDLLKKIHKFKHESEHI